MDVNLKLTSITHTNVEPSAGGEKLRGEKVSYYYGDPQFDEYESRIKAMVSTEFTLPKNFLGPGADCSMGDATKLNENYK